MKTKCKACSKDFDKVAISQDICTSCLISPKRNAVNDLFNEALDRYDPEPDMDQILKEEDVPGIKICTECRKEYEPTSNRQLICHDCREGKSYTQPQPTFEPVPQIAVSTELPPAVRIVSSERTIEALCRDLIKISGCKELSLNYGDLMIRINNHL